jgi:lipid A 4'-phosphatase
MVSLTLDPQMDLLVSGFFYNSSHGFFWDRAPLFLTLHTIATKGAWLLGLFLVSMVLFKAWQKRSVQDPAFKASAFLLLALLLGPVLVANVIFKDHWGRARPHEVVAFHGTSPFTPALIPANNCDKNCSFVAGDAAFGFYCPTFGYTARTRRLRRVFFAGGLCLGSLMGLARIAMGAHFLSDVLYACLFMLLSSALLHALFFGRESTLSHWKEWLYLSDP